MFFSTDSDLSHIYLQYKSEKVHELFALGWKNQEHTLGPEISYSNGVRMPPTYIPDLLLGPRRMMINIVGLQVEVCGQHVFINHV